MQDYKNKKPAPEEKVIKKVVKGNVKTKKKSGLTKFTDVFISEDVANVKSHVLMDVLLPAGKKLLWDIVTDGLDIILYGGNGRSKKNSSKVSYRNYYDRKDEPRHSEPRSRTRFDYDDIEYDNRGDAEAVLDQMVDVIDRYGLVTVADMYDMADRTAPYTSNKYGWTSLRSAEVVRVRGGGYIIKLPRAMAID